MTENQPEAPGRTELEHRIGQATEEAESMAMEGGVARACALRFLAALEVPRSEWPSARDATRSPESAREVPGAGSPALDSLEGVTAILAALEGSDGEVPPLSREELGRLVREVWVACAREHPDPKPSWLAGWDELDEWDKETDRRIGKTVANHAAAVTALAMHALHVKMVAEAVSAERERAEAAEGKLERLLEEITAVRALALTNGIPLADLERMHDAAHAGEDGSEEENGEH